MTMEINNTYKSYANIYTNTLNNSKKTTESIAEAEKSSAVPESTAVTSSISDGMSYLQSMQKSYSNTLFMTGTVSYGQTYGNSSQIAFVVNPAYVSKLGTDLEARAEFEEAVEYLYNFSQKFRAQQAASGWEVISEGWFCDENGNWGGWVATRKTDEKSFLQKMQEKTDKIMQEKTEKRKELKKLEEKRKAKKISGDDKETDERKIKIQDNEKAELKAQIEKPLRKHFGDKWKGVIIIDKDDENEAQNVAFPKADKDNAQVAGFNMNLKI